MYIFFSFCYNEAEDKLMRDKTDYNQLYRIARAYYMTGESEQKISEREGLSRPHVSRLLTKARRIGMVSIDVVMPEFQGEAVYEKKLKELLKLKEVKVTPISSRIIDQQAVSLEIAKFASQVLPAMLSNAHSVGVGLGYTIYQAGRYMISSLNRYNLNIIPLSGYTDSIHAYFQTTIIVNEFAEKLKSSAYYITISNVLEEAKKTETEAETLETLEELWKNVDTAIIGIGGTDQNPRDHDHLKNRTGKRLIGDILALDLYEDGSIGSLKEGYRYVTLDPKRLQEIPKVICIGGGPKKIDAILKGAELRYFNSLITDSETARIIIERIEKDTGH